MLIISKAECRKNTKKIRSDIYNNISKDYIYKISDHLSNIIDENLKSNSSENKNIAFFLPIGSEVEVDKVFDKFISKGYNICLPCVIKKDHPLVFKEWQQGMELIEESYKTKAPNESAKEVMPDVIIVPFLSFDDRGYRLGYGGGFYDRTIANIKTKVITIGVGFEGQKLPQVPTDEYDQTLDYIATEECIYKIDSLG